MSSLFSLKPHSADRHVAPLGHIMHIPIAGKPISALSTSCFAEKQQILFNQSFFIQPGFEAMVYRNLGEPNG